MDKTEHFVRQLTEHQNRLYGYVFPLLGDHGRAADVVQETNLVLWRKIDEFQMGKPSPGKDMITLEPVFASTYNDTDDVVLADPVTGVNSRAKTSSR